MPITPYLYYKDVGSALRFLAAFGFRKYGSQVRGSDGRIHHAAMKLGAGLIMMGQPSGRYRNPKRLGQATQSLYVNVRGVGKHYAQAREAGARIIEEPRETEYSHRRYTAVDLEGHEWVFAEAIPKRRSRRKAR